MEKSCITLINIMCCIDMFCVCATSVCAQTVKSQPDLGACRTGFQ
jgi:hypothetical protein